MTTRREFLLTTAAGLMAMTRHPRFEADQLLYIGTYTTDKSTAEGVHLVRFDTSTGALTHVAAYDAGPNPSFLALHPSGRALYVVNEIDTWNGNKTGLVRAFAINPASSGLAITPASGSFAPLGSMQLSEGAAPCYVSVDGTGRVLLVANYNGGNVAALPIAEDMTVDAATHVVQHMGNGPNKERQEGPHAHCIIPD